MANFAVPVEGALEQRHTLRTLPGTRERNPEIFPSRTVELFELGQHGGAGNRPDVTTPSAAQKWGQSAAGVVRSSGAQKIDRGRGRAAAADSGAAQHIVQVGAAIAAPFVGLAPGGRLLPDFAGRMFQSALAFFLLRQFQQRTQGVFQLKSPPLKDTAVYYTGDPVEKHSKQKKTWFARKRYRE